MHGVVHVKDTFWSAFSDASKVICGMTLEKNL